MVKPVLHTCLLSKFFRIDCWTAKVLCNGQLASCWWAIRRLNYAVYMKEHKELTSCPAPECQQDSRRCGLYFSASDLSTADMPRWSSKLEKGERIPAQMYFRSQLEPPRHRLCHWREVAALSSSETIPEQPLVQARRTEHWESHWTRTVVPWI